MAAVKMSPAAWWRRAPRWQRALLLSALVVAILLGGASLHTYARLEGWLTERLTPDALSAKLSPHYTVDKPDGPGPFPTALLFSGCDGVADNMTRWSDALVAAGWATMIVDSHTPRDLDDYEVWRLVCAGQVMPGAERAGDVMVSMADAMALPFVDANRLAVIGMSHGGWSIMELLALTDRGRLPFNLTAAPPSLAGNPLSGIVAEILVYPWCGLANRGRRYGWTHDAPVVFLLAEDDLIAPAYECQITARTLRDMGRTVTVETFSGVTHGFDQMEHAPFTTLEFDAEATERAIATALGVLNNAAFPAQN